MSNSIPAEYRGWWRITETGTWAARGLDSLGPALMSLTGKGDRLRMHALVAHITPRVTKTGVSFSWEGSWEYDSLTGTGRVQLTKDGLLTGVLRIKAGDQSTFVAERTEPPRNGVEAPPSYRDKWRRGR